MDNFVYTYRKKNKLTQEGLAKLLGVTRQTIISIEQKRYIASLPLALKMAKIFNVPVEELFILEKDDLDEFGEI